MKRNNRLRLLASLTVAFWALIFIQPPIPQDITYHLFADQRTLLGIPHCLNVLSNLPFLLVGLIGFRNIARIAQGRGQTSFVRPADSVTYQVLFASVALVGIGSAYYHLAPTNTTLLWDRLPMSVALMSFLAIAISEHIDRRTGIIALLPLIGFGLFSVLYWHATEQTDSGDLRYYVLTQAYPIVFVPCMVKLLPSPYTRGSDLYVVVMLYGVAKAAEIFDETIFGFGHLISGHTLKHLFSAIGVYWMLRMVHLRTVADSAKVNADI